MNWQAIEEDRELKELFNKFDYIVFKYLKGSNEEAIYKKSIEEMEKLGWDKNDPSFSRDFELLNDKELFEKLPKEMSSSKVALLGELYRCNSQDPKQFVLTALETYPFVAGILSREEMDVLNEEYGAVVDLILDDLCLPEEELYPIPDNLAIAMTSRALEETEDDDLHNIMTIDSGLGELVDDMLFRINEHYHNRQEGDTALFYEESNLLGKVLTEIRLDAYSSRCTDNELEYLNRAQERCVDIAEMDIILYIGNKFFEDEEDPTLFDIYKQMKNGARLVFIANSSWLKKPYIYETTDSVLKKSIQDKSLYSITELPAKIWHETEKNTSLVTIWKFPHYREQEDVRFANACNCKSKKREYALTPHFSLEMSEFVWPHSSENKSANYASFDLIAKNKGYLVPDLYLGKISLSTLIYGRPIWNIFDEAYKRFDSSKSLFSKQVLIGTLLYLSDIKTLGIGSFSLWKENKDMQILSTITRKELSYYNSIDKIIHHWEMNPDDWCIAADVSIWGSFYGSILDNLITTCDKFQILDILVCLEIKSIDDESNCYFDAFLRIFPDLPPISNDNLLTDELKKIVENIIPNGDNYYSSIELARQSLYFIELEGIDKKIVESIAKATLVRDYLTEDSFKNWTSYIKEEKSFNLFIQPLFGGYYKQTLRTKTPVEYWVIEHSIDNLADKGIALGIFESSLLTRADKIGLDFRKWLTSKQVLDKVVLLPPNYLVFGKSICLITFCKESKDCVCMVDATACLQEYNSSTSQMLDFERVIALMRSDGCPQIEKVAMIQIEKSNYNLSPGYYCPSIKKRRKAYNVANLIATYKFPSMMGRAESVSLEGNRFFEGDAISLLLDQYNRHHPSDVDERINCYLKENHKNPYIPGILTEDEELFLYNHYKELVDIILATEKDVEVNNLLTPDGLVRLIGKLMPLKLNSSIYMPNAYHSTYAMAYPHCHMVNVELDYFSWALSEIRKDAWNLKIENYCEIGFEPEGSSCSDGLTQDFCDETRMFDAIIENAKFLEWNTFSDKWFYEDFCRLKPEGQMTVLVNTDLFNQPVLLLEDHGLRTLVEKQHIKAIIQLPTKLWNEKICSVSILMLGNKKYDEIRIVDATSLYINKKKSKLQYLDVDAIARSYNDKSSGIAKTISYDEVRQYGGILRPEYYFLKHPTNECSLFCISNVQEECSLTTAVPCKTISSNNLEKGFPKQPIVLSKLNKKSLLKTNVYIGPAVILSVSESGIKLGYISQKEYFSCTSSLIILAPRKGISTQYLAALLTDKNVQVQLNMLYSEKGSSSMGIESKQIGLTKEALQFIRVPNHNEKDAAKYLHTVLNTAMTEMEASLQSAFTKYKNDTHMKKHAIGQELESLSGIWENLMTLHARNNGVLEDGQKYGSSSVAGMLERIGHIIDSVTHQIDIFTIEEDKTYKTVDVINISSFLNAFVKQNEDPDFIFELNDIDDSLIITFSKNALICILKNLIYNARKHGFNGRKAGYNNIVRISTKVIADDIIISVSNNGIAFKHGIEDKIFEYGSTTKRGQDGHSGTGCFEVKKLMTSNNRGDVEVVSDPDSDFPVMFNLIFHIQD